MSHVNIKTTYNIEGDYGTTETKTLFCDHNNCADYVTFYDDKGDWLLTVPDTIDNNLLDAINRLYAYYDKNASNNLKENIEYMTNEERELCKNGR